MSHATCSLFSRKKRDPPSRPSTGLNERCKRCIKRRLRCSKVGNGELCVQCRNASMSCSFGSQRTLKLRPGTSAGMEDTAPEDAPAAATAVAPSTSDPISVPPMTAAGLTVPADEADKRCARCIERNMRCTRIEGRKCEQCSKRRAICSFYHHPYRIWNAKPPKGRGLDASATSLPTTFPVVSEHQDESLTLACDWCASKGLSCKRGKVEGRKCQRCRNGGIHCSLVSAKPQT